MRCVAEIYSVSNTYQTDKFQYVELLVNEAWLVFANN